MRYFGTDGIRDDADALLKSGAPYFLGKALSAACGKVVVARDVRTSSAAIERMLTRGMLEGEAQVCPAGVLPTPALAYAAQAHDARFAVMITASHNAPNFNGLKVFSRRGQKLSSREEEALDDAICTLAAGEALTEEFSQTLAADCSSLKDTSHRVCVLKDVQSDYLSRVISLFPRFDGMRVTLDAAHGCMARLATRAFEALGVQVSAINDDRDGGKVNVDCGSTHMGAILAATPAGEMGFAFDGDGDRVLAVVDGKIYDGDAILLALATMYRAKGKLRNKIAVGTLLTNSRLQSALASQNVALVRADVGDKHVLAAMNEHGSVLGGEKSGHILMLDKAPTGDGLLTALSLLEAKLILGRLPIFDPYPMLQFDIPSPDPAKEMQSERMTQKLASLRNRFDSVGRFVFRASGTEPFIRVAFECFSPDFEDVFKKIKSEFKLSKNDV